MAPNEPDLGPKPSLLRPAVAHRDDRLFSHTPAPAALRDELLSAFSDAAGLYAVLGARETLQIHAPWADTHRAHYDPVVWQRLSAARALTPATIADAETRHARLLATWKNYFAHHDFLVLPGSPCAALTKPECQTANRTRLLSLTAPVSLAGLPALALPVTLPSGLTAALQVVTPHATGPVFPTLLAQWE